VRACDVEQTVQEEQEEQGLPNRKSPKFIVALIVAIEDVRSDLPSGGDEQPR
jgi:hypothetical protein